MKKRLLRLLQEEAEPVLRKVLEDPLTKQADRVVADAFRGIIDTSRRLLAHRMSAVEDAVHSGHADARSAGKVGDRRSIAHRLPLK
ncbi:hypothetical protein D9M69_723180 [compost metagenome]